MSQPTPYTRQYDFTDYQASTPSDPLPANQVDAELNAAKTTIDQILTNLAILQRDDTKLGNLTVHLDSLDADVKALLALTSATIRGAWLTATAYALGDVVTTANITYLCAVAHTSGTFATDLAADKWVAIAGPAANIVFTPAGSIAATDVQSAIEELDTEKEPVFTSASAKTVTPTSGTTARTLAALHADAINVLSFGATGDGVADDTAAITAAIAAASGKSLVVPKGTYLVDGIDIDQSLELVLAAGATIKAAAGNAVPCVTVSVSNVTIRGAGPSSKIEEVTTAINAVKIDAGLSNVTIRDLWAKGAGKTEDASNRSQGNCIHAQGTALSKCTNIVIDNVYMTDGHNGVLMEFCDHSAVRNCFLNFSHDAWTGITLWSCDWSAVENNRLLDSGTTSTAIEIIHSTDDPCLFTAITGNVIKGTWGAEGINLFGAHAAVTGNTVDLTSGDGAPCRITQQASDTVAVTHSNNVSANVFRANGDGALIHIQELDGALTCNDNVVVGNFCEQLGTGAGIVINTRCARNIIARNRVKAGSGTTSDGITAQAADYNEIVGNIVSDAGRNGIYVNTGDYARVEGNHVFDSTNYGILIDGSTDAIVLNNYSHGDGDRPLGVFNATPLIVAGNVTVTTVNGPIFDVYTKTLPLDLHALRQAAALKDALPDTPDGTTLGLGDTAGSVVTGTTTNSGGTASASETCSFQFVLPESYNAAGAVTLRVRAQVSAARQVAQTVDAVVKEVGADGALGADICATAAQALTTSYADYSFIVTPTNLVAGDILNVVITLAADDTGGGTNGFPTSSQVAFIVSMQG